MTVLLIVSNLVLWLLVLSLAFLLLGSLRSLGLLSWRLEQLEATTPSRLGRDGLKVGKKAPEFTLPSVTGGERSLRDFAGRQLLLVFTQSGCGPCTGIVPELNRLRDSGEVEVLAINNGDLASARQWANDTGIRFPLLAQEQFSVSKTYQVIATPFAFLLDAKGVVTSKGFVSSRQHLEYVLTGAGNRAKQHHGEPEPNSAVKGESLEPISSKEVSHV